MNGTMSRRPCLALSTLEIKTHLAMAMTQEVTVAMLALDPTRKFTQIRFVGNNFFSRRSPGALTPESLLLL